MRRNEPGYTVDGFARRLAAMERQIADLQRVRNPPPVVPPAAAGGGTIPFLVAAADAPDEWKAVAAYQCDQTDDAVTIQAAIDDVSDILLSPGTFYLPSGGLVLGMDQTLAGSGPASILYADGSAITAGTRAIVRSITFNFYNSATGAIGVDAGANNGELLVEDCWFVDIDTGVHLASSNGATVRRCDFFSLGVAGIDDTNASRCRVESCRFDVSGAEAIVVGGSNWIIANNHVVNGDVQIDGDENLLIGNQITSGGSVTIGAGAAATAFVSNYLQSGAGSYSNGGTGTQKPTNGNFSSAGLW